MEYKPRPDIARIQSFNLPEGVSHHHLQWAIGKFPVNGDVETKIFKVGNIDVGGSSKLELKFRMVYSIDEASNAGDIKLCRIRGENDPDGPIIVRFGIFNDKAGIRMIDGRPTLNYSTIRFNCIYWKIFDKERKDLQAANDGFVIHYWLDMPNKVIESKQRPSDPQGGRENCGPALLSSIVANLFNEVIAVNGGAKGTSDIILVTDEGEKDERRFFCHAAVLVGRSPVFQAMLDGDHFKEGKERVAKIEDIQGYAMEIQLKYMYKGDCSNIPIDAIPQVVHAAEKYMLPELRDECLFALINNIVRDGAWIDHLLVAEKFSIQYFKKICILALSTNMRFFEDVQIRGKLHPESMTDLLRMVAQRIESTKVIEISTEE